MGQWQVSKKAHTIFVHLLMQNSVTSLDTARTACCFSCKMSVAPPYIYIYIYKVHLRTGHKGPKGECSYSYILPSTSALDREGGQRHAPAALLPVKTRYPLYRGLGGPQGWSGPVRIIWLPPGFDPRTVQPVASRYTD